VSAGAVITVYDGVDATGKKLATITPTAPGSLFYSTTLETGLFVVVSVAAADFDVVMADTTDTGSVLAQTQAFALAAVQAAVAALPPPSGGGALTLLASKVLAAPAASVDITGIPGTATHLLIKIIGASSGDAEADQALMVVNGDTQPNYAFNGSQTARNTAPVNIGTNSTTSVVIGPMPTADTDAPGIIEVTIPDYTSTVWFKAFQASGSFMDWVNEIGAQKYDIGGSWIGPSAGGVSGASAAITDLTFKLASGDNFVAHSAFYVYGLT
jgi:hypothetical protein